MVYQKITNQPDFSIEDYLTEAKRTIDNAESKRIFDSAETKKTIDTAVVKPTEPQSVSDDLRELQAEIPIIPEDKPRSFNKRILYGLAGIGAILFVTLAVIIGYKIITAGSSAAHGVGPTITSSVPTNTLGVTVAIIAPITTETQIPTITLFPTYTPRPSTTPVPSITPNLTKTLGAAFTPTGTQTVLPPTPTRTPTRTRTPVTPTDTHIPQTEGPPATITPRPTPTATEPPPVVIESCSIDPSTVPPGFNISLTFSVNFSAPGYGFTSKIQANYPDQSDCSGTDTNGDGTASCNGSSGLIPGSTKVDVIFSSSVGDCTASFSSP